MNFSNGDLIRWIYPAGDRIERILHAPPASDFVIVYAWADDETASEAKSNAESALENMALMGIPTTPFERTTGEIATAIANSECITETNDVWARGIEPQNEREKNARDQIAKKVFPILADGTSHLSPTRRGKLIEEAIEQSGGGKEAIYRALRQLWKSNYNVNSLTPAFRERGGLGSAKFLSTHKNGAYVTTALDRSHIAKALKDTYLTTKKPSFDMCHRYLLDKFYSPDGCLLPANLYPSKRSFIYHAHKIVGVKEAIIAREGLKKYQKDRRPKLGSTMDRSAAPGDLIELDSTVLDCHVVDPIDRSKTIGKPYFYVAPDGFCGGPAGYSLTLNAPSYLGATLAIANCTADKIAHCAKHGVEIDKAQWPYEGLSKVYVADGGEIDSTQAETLSTALGTGSRVTTIAAYRPERKPMVEMMFSLINRELQLMEGRVRKKMKERGERDPKLDAILTLQEVEEVVIRTILMLWKRVRMKHCLDRQMMSLVKVPSPLNLWDFGIKYRGSPRRSSSENVNLALLPRDVATVTQQGIRFKGVYFTCKRALDQDWFVQAGLGTWTIPIAYHPKYVDNIYLVHSDPVTSLETCDLTPRCKSLEGLTWEDVENYFRVQAQEVKAYKESVLRPAEVALTHRVSEIRKSARRATALAIQDSGVSKTARTKNVRLNRADEIERLRKLNAPSPGGTKAPDVEPSASAPEYVEPPDNADHLEALLAKRQKSQK